MKKIEEIKISQIKPKNYELKVENNLNCKGLYEFKGKIPKKTHNQKIKIPQQFFKILSQKILSDIADYEKIVKHYKAKKPYDITSHKITQVLLQTKIENKNQSNKKLLKQDLFILNLLLKIQKKGISNIIHKDIELLETIIYERKQQIKTLINYIFLPIEPYLSKPIMRAGPIDRKVNQNLPQIKFNGTHHTDLKKIESFFSNELKKTVKVNENNNLKNFDSKSILSLKINSTNQIKQTVKSKNKNSPGPFKKIKSEIPKSSSENKNNKIIERNKTINDLFNFNNRKKKDFSKIRKIHSCETNLSSYSYEGNTLRNNNKLFLSEEDMIQVADKTSIIQAHKQGFPEKQQEQKDERKNFNSWSQFLKKSIEFSQTLPEIIKTYDFSNDSLYNETVSKVENFLKDFFNKKNINDVTEKTRVKTILNEKEKRKPRKKRNERLQKHNIDLSPINKNLRKKLKRIKNISKIYYNFNSLIIIYKNKKKKIRFILCSILEKT